VKPLCLSPWTTSLYHVPHLPELFLQLFTAALPLEIDSIRRPPVLTNLYAGPGAPSGPSRPLFQDSRIVASLLLLSGTGSGHLRSSCYLSTFPSSGFEPLFGCCRAAKSSAPDRSVRQDVLAASFLLLSTTHGLRHSGHFRLLALFENVSSKRPLLSAGQVLLLPGRIQPFGSVRLRAVFPGIREVLIQRLFIPWLLVFSFVFFVVGCSSYFFGFHLNSSPNRVCFPPLIVLLAIDSPRPRPLRSRLQLYGLLFMIFLLKSPQLAK